MFDIPGVKTRSGQEQEKTVNKDVRNKQLKSKKTMLIINYEYGETRLRVVKLTNIFSDTFLHPLTHSVFSNKGLLK